MGSKRAFSPVFEDDDDVDYENVDPLEAGSKRTKAIDGSPLKHAKPMFNLSVKVDATKDGATFGKKVDSVPSSKTQFGCHSAPAGRSPPSKRAARKGPLRTSYKRVDPPGSRSNQLASLRSSGPLSIDAALGSISSSNPASKALDDVVPIKKRSSRAKPVDVRCDSPVEEVTNKMAHPTLVINSSSDNTLKKFDVGKENVAPADYMVQPRGRRLRRRVSDADMMIPTVDRAALDTLLAADFYGDGLDESSVTQVETEYLDHFVGETFDHEESTDSVVVPYDEVL